jgi:pimeloyl-ACP methyl ester carboxylesterase
LFFDIWSRFFVFFCSYEQLDLPTLVVWGQNDRLGALGSTFLLAIPGSTALMLPNAGHACYLEDTATFHEGLLAFVAKCAASGQRRRRLSDV